ncbi:MAG: PVC-type heme-binding CxxCH protein [Balneolaceae bacterium]
MTIRQALATPILFLLSLALFACTSTSGISTSQEQQAENNTSISTTTHSGESDSRYLHALFLGDNGQHQPEARVQQLIPYLSERGIQIHYTDRMEELNPENLNRYSLLITYGNRIELSTNQERNLLNYVEEGGGLIAIHSGGGQFKYSDAWISLVGGSFLSHGYDTVRTIRSEPDHPIMKDLAPFESPDETYIHMKHNPDKTVLSVRMDGEHAEPWTWVRTHGEGRVFYTAWGHNQHTWGNPGFHELIERAIRWAAGPAALERDFSPPELTYGNEELLIFPFGAGWRRAGDRFTSDQKPLLPEDAREHVVAKPGFSVELFASEPDIVNPVDMAWDERGRLWVLETIDYPNDFAPDRIGNDKIKILEDTNGDGKADQVTIWASGLNIATSLTHYKDGVLVAQAPDILYLKDTNGDGTADKREVLFTGWGTFDTHAGPGNLQYGFDNQIWGAVGYSAFEGTVGGDQHRFSSGFYRFKPDGSSLEFISNTTNNTWGLTFNEEGEVFGSTANDNPAVHIAVPNRYYHLLNGSGGTPRLPMIANHSRIFPIVSDVRQIDQIGRYTGASGFHIYTARSFPEEYWNRRAFVGEATGHLLGEFILEPSGSSWQALNARNFLATRDEWFSPVQTKTGPDGAVWVLDWQNLLVQHITSPYAEGAERGEGNAFISDIRDREHGRVYRVVYNGTESDSRFSLEGATTRELVATLQHENLFWRLTSQRLLVERSDDEAVPALLELVADLQVSEAGLNPGALHALWTLHGLGRLDGSDRTALNAAYSALYHPSVSVRRAALQVLPKTRETLEEVLRTGLLPNPDFPVPTGYRTPEVYRRAGDARLLLTTLLSVAEMPSSSRVGHAAARLLIQNDVASDRWLRDAVAAAAAPNSFHFLRTLSRSSLPSEMSDDLRDDISATVERISRHFALETTETEDITEILLLLPDGDMAIANGVLEGMAEAWSESEPPRFSESDLNSIGSLKQHLDPSLHEHLDAIADSSGRPDLFGE